MQKITTMTRSLALLLLLCASCLRTYALDAVAAYTVFYKKVAQNNTYLPAIEAYWQANPKTLHFTKNKDGLYEASIITAITITNDTGTLIEQKFRFKANSYPSLESAQSQNLADKYDYPLPPGQYTINIALFQQGSEDEAYQFSDTFTIAQPPANTPFLSGIQLIDTFFASGAATIYNRNGNVEIPFPANYYDETKPLVKFYTEVYNCGSLGKDLFPLRIHSFLSWKQYGSSIPPADEWDTVATAPAVTTTYMHKKYDIESLESGNYYLNMFLSDKNNKILDKRSIFFQRYNPNPKKKPEEKIADTSTAPVNVLDLSTTFVGKYNIAQLRAILKMLSVISDPVESEAISAFLRKPEELYMRYFILNFWKKRNPANPEASWKEFAAKIKEVNKMFGTNNLPGYESDRGQIFLKYGKPNDRIIVNSETGALPYELWQYFAAGPQHREAVFLFYKPGGQLGEYILLHSTLYGERRNGKWRSLLYSNNIVGTPLINNNSQAEQYIGNK